MTHPIFCIFLFIIFLLPFNATGQTKSTLTGSFRLEHLISQNDNTFKFWRGLRCSSKNRIIIERIRNTEDTIIFNELAWDGIYNIYDVNHDGLKDLILNYHDYDVVYFFTKKKKNFNYTPVYLPDISGILNLGKNVHWGYREAQYSEKYDYSILYKFIDCNPYFYSKIVYKTAAEYEGRSHVLKIELYKFELGDYEKPIFIKEIKTANPATFSYKKYWNKNYKQLMRYH